MAEPGPDLILATCVENNGPMLLAIGWVLLALAIIAILLRIVFRHRYGNGLRADDYTMLASMTMAITAVIFLTLFVNAGLGRHIYCLPPGALPLMFKYSILAQIFNIAGIGLVKISVCLHILRIVDRAGRYISLFLRLLILITFLSHMAQILLFCVQCRPMPAIWSPQEYPHAKCFSSHITYLAGYIGFGLDAFTDLVTAIIPILVIRALQMNTRTKTALCLLMGLGVLTAVCAIAKAITLQGVFAEDYTWALWRPGLCTIIEHLMGMIIASAPALNPLFKRALRTPTSLYSSSHSHGSRRSAREGRDEDERQSRRVTRWADAWTPPNVHVAHYSPYASSEKNYSGGEKMHHRHSHLHSSSTDPITITPSSCGTATSDSDTTAVNSSHTIIGGALVGGERCGEITKTVSFGRVSKHENGADEGGLQEVGTTVGEGWKNDVIARLPDETLARAEEREPMADRLWIGNGCCGLPHASTTGAGPEAGLGGWVQNEVLPPHPAVGRWVRSGAERPVAKGKRGYGLLPIPATMNASVAREVGTLSSGMGRGGEEESNG